MPEIRAGESGARRDGQRAPRRLTTSSRGWTEAGVTVSARLGRLRRNAPQCSIEGGGRGGA